MGLLTALKGTLEATTESDGAIGVNVGGVVYRCVVHDRDRRLLNVRGPGAEVSLHVRDVHREDDVTLFAFTCILDRKVFDAIRSADGFGPATALRVLSVMRREELVKVQASKDVGRLMEIPGIGKKSAEKLCALVGL